VVAVEPFKTFVTLAQIKADKKFSDMALVKYARLSVQPVTSAEWAEVCRMGGMSGAAKKPAKKK
jgi:predicted RNA-binding protein with PUA-like domain